MPVQQRCDFRPWRRPDGARLELRTSPIGRGHAVDLLHDTRDGCRWRRLAVLSSYPEARALYDRWQARLDCLGRDLGNSCYHLNDPEEREIDAQRHASYVWRARRGVEGTPAETYLREVCGLVGEMPTCFAFLRPQDNEPAALLAAYGWLDEPVDAVHVVPLMLKGYGLAGTPFDLGTPRGPIILRQLQFEDAPEALVIAHSLESGLVYYNQCDAAVVVTGDPTALWHCESLATYAQEIAIEPTSGGAFANSLREFASCVRKKHQGKPMIRVIIN